MRNLQGAEHARHAIAVAAAKQIDDGLRGQQRLIAAPGGTLSAARDPSIRLFCYEGGLISYGFDAVDQFRQGAVYADKILKGARPADLPVQHPTKFEININLKTAKALGLDVPLQLLQLADEVLE
jgi:ABC transporter substrate binding protein